MTPEDKRTAALEFIDFVNQSGAASPIMIEQLKLAARMWAVEQGASDDLQEMHDANMRIMEEHAKQWAGKR